MTAVLMSHFILRAPPPLMRTEVYARGQAENCWIKPVKLSYDEILEQLEKIGDDWHLRPEHQGNKRKKTKDKLESNKTHTWLFMRGDTPIGFCIAVKNGFDSSLADKFGIAAKGSEIYKIGLFPDYQHKGYGHVFLPTIQVALLNGQGAVPSKGILPISPNDRVYLNTRDTNRTDSRAFYRANGWDMVGEETWIPQDTDISGELTHTLVPISSLGPPIVEQDNSARKPRPLMPYDGDRTRAVG